MAHSCVRCFRSLYRIGRTCLGLALLLIGMTTVAWADADDRYDRDGRSNDAGRHDFDHRVSFDHEPARFGWGNCDPSRCHPSPPSDCHHHPSPVPEIDAGAAAGALALLVGIVMLLRDRALSLGTAGTLAIRSR